MSQITPDESQFLIPLTNTPQSFDIELGSQNYTLVVRWNDADEGGWVMDVLAQDSQNAIACNIPFITGADMLEGLEYLGIPGQLIAYTNGDQWAVPTIDNLGSNSNLYFFTAVP
jgi:hypothetical protein